MMIIHNSPYTIYNRLTVYNNSFRLYNMLLLKLFTFCAPLLGQV